MFDFISFTSDTLTLNTLDLALEPFSLPVFVDLDTLEFCCCQSCPFALLSFSV